MASSQNPSEAITTIDLMAKAMTTNRDKLREMVLRDMLADLQKNDGENLREMILYAKKSKSKKVKKDLETICSHPALKPLVTH